MRQLLLLYPARIACRRPPSLSGRAEDAPLLEIDLPRSRRAPAIARAAVEDATAGMLGRRARTDLALVVTELVANAVAHGEGRVVLKAWLDEGSVRVEVVDDGTGHAPSIRREAGSETGGFGLRIVEAVALRWGAFEGTTHVWAELPRR